MADPVKKTMRADGGTRSPALFLAIVVFIVAALLAFLLLRPVGSDAGAGTYNPAAPTAH